MTAPTKEASRAASGTIALGGHQIVGRGLALVFVIVGARVVVPQEFARYAIAAGLVALAGFLADFGTTTVITRMVSREPTSSDELLGQTLLSSVAVGAIAYLAVVAFAVLGPYSAATRTDVVIAGLAIPLDAALTSLIAALDGRGLIARRAFVSFARVAVVMGGGAIALAVTGNIRLAIVMIPIGSAVGLGAAVALAHRHGVWRVRLHPSYRRSIEILRVALPYALLGGIGAVVARLDLIVLSAIGRAADVAQYDMALRGTEALVAIGSVVGAPALYLLSRRLGAGDIQGAGRAYRQAIRFAYLLGLPMATILIALHGPITNVVLGSRYADAAPLLALLAGWVGLSILGTAQGSVVLADGAPGRIVRVSLVVLVTAVALDAALIPWLGAEGAALATLGAEIVSCWVFDRMNARTLGIHTPLPPARLVGACVVSGTIMFAASSAGDWWGLLSLSVLPIVCLWFGVIARDDVRHLRLLVAERSSA
jgi:O-antigen/teichoic acid export membrane protein